MSLMPLFVTAAIMFWGNPALPERQGVHKVCPISKTSIRIQRHWSWDFIEKWQIGLETDAFALSPAYYYKWPCRIWIYWPNFKKHNLAQRCTIVVHEFGHTLYKLPDQWTDKRKIMYGGPGVVINPKCKLLIHLLHVKRRHHKL